ncbi:Clo7bot family Cys-rich peptide [Gottschalkia purinilytica]
MKYIVNAESTYKESYCYICGGQCQNVCGTQCFKDRTKN